MLDPMIKVRSLPSYKDKGHYDDNCRNNWEECHDVNLSEIRLVTKEAL